MDLIIADVTRYVTDTGINITGTESLHRARCTDILRNDSVYETGASVTRPTENISYFSKTVVPFRYTMVPGFE